MPTLLAGAATTDITPATTQFLAGYPLVERYSRGTHDPLLSSALYLSDGQTQVLFISNDVIFLMNQTVQRVRQRISRETGIPAGHIMATATHTHSGPMTTQHRAFSQDPIAPDADPAYIQALEDGIVAAAVEAHRSARLAKVGLAIAHVQGVGTNRHDPAGPADPHAPVLVARDAKTDQCIAVMTIYAMHPTVLHEDSKLFSADFPGYARQYLQKHVLDENCPVVHLGGAMGNQSPRHMTKANTFDEAQRLGELLGQAIEQALKTVTYADQPAIRCRQSFTELPLRPLPSLAQAQETLEQVKDRFDSLRQSQAPRTDVRTAECDWFGARRTLTLAKARDEGRLDAAIRACMPAEIQVIQIGPWSFVGWPGEVFVEFALEIRRRHPQAFVITLANGKLEGYLATAQALAQRRYEALTAVFKAQDAAQTLVAQTLKMLEER